MFSTQRTTVRLGSAQDKTRRRPVWITDTCRDKSTAISPGAKERRWSASSGSNSKKWRNNSSLDVFDKLMVRADRGGRQMSLETPQRPSLQRQASEDLRPPGPLKIAWAQEQMEPSVEVVAKKCGQPKPSNVKPPRSPYHSDENAAVLYSRQLLTERLRSSWKKSSGRHNLNIFLNQSVESETDDVSEVVDSPLTRSPSSSEEDEPPPGPALKDRGASINSSASDRRAAFRMMGRQSKILDSPCSTPEPSKPPAMRRMMSAPSRPTTKKLSKAASVEVRVKSAPSKRKHKQPQQRRRAKGDSSDEDKTSGRRVKRGVEKGEIVTMVSLVSPAESEEEATPAPTPDIKRPPTPKPPPESPRPNPPPPPILSLRKPSKAVTFRPVVQPQQTSTQYQTSFPLKRTLVHQNTTGSVGPTNSRPLLQRQATLPSTPSSLASTATTPSSLASTPRPSTTSRPKGDLEGDTAVAEEAAKPPRIVRKPSIAQPVVTVRRKVLQATHSVIKIEPEPIKEAELPPTPTEEQKKLEGEEMSSELEVNVEEKPVFKNSKEKECWALFKKMSDRGVSVSFETVLRGLLTPTEYRMRRAALMSVC